jgi:hypothetical protein
MRVLKWLGAGLVWIVAGVVGLLGVVLSVTLILLPLGIPLLMLARRLAGLATAMVVPKAVRDPVGVLSKKGSQAGDDAGKKARALTESVKSKTKKKKGFLGFKRKSNLDRFVDWVLS